MNNPPPEKWDPIRKSNPQPTYGETLNLKNPAFDYFPQELIDLRIEVQKHPELLKLMAEQEDKDVYIQLLEIATYCKVLVMGDYTRDDMLKLCKVLTQKLMSMRTLIIVPPLI